MPTTNEERIYVLNAKADWEKTRLARLIEWYRQWSMPLLAKDSMVALGNWFMRVCTLGLWFVLVEPLFHQTARQLDLHTAAQRFNDDSSLDANPPAADTINMKSDTQSFNHINDYVIHNGMIWYRRRKDVYAVSEGADKVSTQLSQQEGPWRRVFFDGALHGRKPVSLCADGANLSVLDDLGEVHYRKILLEGRGYEEIHQESSEHEPMSTHFGAFDLEADDKNTYVAVDITQQMTWAEYWYNFPVLNVFVNFLMKNLSLTGLVAHSHRGRFNDGFTDVGGNYHPTSVGCTTTYQSPLGGTEILKHDPWAPIWSKVPFYFPETEEKAFVASSLDSSASRLVALGYEVNKQTGKGQLTLLTQFCDIDILGGNPMLNYRYQTEVTQDPKRAEGHVFILPDLVEDEGWHKVDLPEQAQHLYNRLTVVQGHHDKRWIRLAGLHEDGRVGYFEKAVTASSSWTFYPDATLQGSAVLPMERDCEFNRTEPTPVDCQGRVVCGAQAIDVKVRHFGLRAYHSELELEAEQGPVRLGLHRRWGLGTFLGLEDKSKYELVIPDTAASKVSALGLFGNKRVIPVTVMQHEQRVEIRL